MDEHFLHYVWKFQKLDGQLKTTSGEDLIVINPGNHNHNSGPDFEESRIRIGDIEWAGKIEIHINSSDWNTHNHHKDKAYESVILHVVWDHDKDVLIHNAPIPTLELKNLVNKSEHKKYVSFINQNSEILCQDQLSGISKLTFTNQLDRMMVERLEQKAIEILELVKTKNDDWEETLYLSLARNFGFSVNKEPFFTMASSLPHKVISKNVNKDLAVEALIFGQAGFLEMVIDDYQKELKKEYEFLKSKHQLTTRLSKEMWKFGRMRPSNFPTVRLAQFSALLKKNDHMFSKIIQIDNPIEVLNQLAFEVSNYWNSHYDFEKKRTRTGGNVGTSTVENLIINTIAPIFSAYSKYTSNQNYMDKAIRILETLPPENNNITKKWSAINKAPLTAFDSQSLIGLYKNYCSKKRCLDCGIGVDILQR